MRDAVRLILTGEILPGFVRDDVHANLAALLKLDAERSRRLLDAAPTVIKQQLPQSQIDTYLALLRQAGAAVRVEHLDGRPWRQPLADTAFPALFDEIQPQPARPTAQAPQAPQAAALPGPVPAAPEPAVLALADAAVPESIKCPACNLEQHKRTLCSGCGTDMPRMLAAQNQARIEARQAQPAAGGPRTVSGLRPGEATQPGIDETPRLFGLQLTGRLGRMRYLAYGMLLVLALVPITLVFSLALLFLKGFWVVFGMAWLWLFMRLVVFRLHDIGLSGWWGAAGLALPLVVLLIDTQIGSIVSMVGLVGSMGLCLWPGDTGPNRFGPPAEPPTMLINVLAVVGFIASLPSMSWLIQNEHVMLPGARQGTYSDAELAQMVQTMRAQGIEITVDELRAQMASQAQSR
ncbi:DUF805 domain-containing protein [Chitiniphilus purpureus]|uniref:DUF805 domain-containing protein n=1 Tax=Chitiniphilus purpureus TaxID=2981137 RepID=A0ABY6DPC7_9NEIS|nr:DUF805 domain-containing protein [Chitiniphilus sp. CD1]UXY16240.1 DUF805 domain-containing protein [Chitiniphilus sp. CD1]